jgi:1-acyl-sn-glycerol-3-phosphate acyltransferase
MRGEWLDSGDLGYIAGGELFVTGRAKDLVIRAGRNLVPEELEAAVWEVEGVRKGCVAIFGARSESTGTERLIVLAETRETDRERRARMRQAIVAAVNDVAGAPPDEVVLAPPATVLKTSSGKIRRSACRELYERGDVESGRPAVWRQMTSLVLLSVGPFLERSLRELATVLYSLAAWLLLGVVVALLVPVLVLLPGARARRRAVRAGARTLLALLGLRPRVCGEDHLGGRDGGPYLLATNHSSYADAVVVAAVMPPEVGIVAKAELAAIPASRFLFRRAGIEFVERFDRERGLEDSRRLVADLRGGRPLLFFPEGTFTRMPGLLPFRMGAFVAAAGAGVPVVPMVIRGTRSVLRSGEWRLHRGEVAVEILEPIAPGEGGWAATVELRDRVRRALLERLGEPDLVAEREEGLEKLRAQRAARERRGEGGASS